MRGARAQTTPSHELMPMERGPPLRPRTLP